MTLSNELARLVANQGGRTALTDLARGHSFTFSELQAEAERRARDLVSLLEGSRIVGVLARNRIETMALLYAAARLGIMIFPVNWRLTKPEIEAQFADCGCDLLLYEAEFEDILPDGVSCLPYDHAGPSGTELPEPPTDAELPLVLVYTSGSTGFPKGAILSQRALIHASRNLGEPYLVTSNSVMLCDMPLFHVIGICATANGTLLRGGHVRLTDRFEPERTAKELSSGHVTHYVSVPQMAEVLAQTGSLERFAGLTGYVVGGAPISDSLISAWQQAGVPLTNSYGMSETCGTATAVRMEGFDPRIGDLSCGSAVDDLEIRVRSATGDIFAEGQGEIVVRGGASFSGYLGRARHGQDEWFETGDLGRIDAYGRLWVLGRVKEMFISGGENIYPAEVENVLFDVPGVTEVCVIGAPDERWGQVGHAYYAASSDIDAEAMRAFCSERLARYKTPANFTRLDKLPRTATGKIDRRALEGQA